MFLSKGKPLRITQHATSVTVDQGEKVTFAITVNRRDASFQWETNRSGKYVDIPGATTGVFITVADVTQSFRCKTWVSGQKPITSTASMTVRIPAPPPPTPPVDPPPTDPQLVNRAREDQADFTTGVDGWTAGPNTKVEHTTERGA